MVHIPTSQPAASSSTTPTSFQFLPHNTTCVETTCLHTPHCIDHLIGRVGHHEQGCSGSPLRRRHDPPTSCSTSNSFFSSPFPHHSIPPTQSTSTHNTLDIYFTTSRFACFLILHPCAPVSLPSNRATQRQKITHRVSLQNQLVNHPILAWKILLRILATQVPQQHPRISPRTPWLCNLFLCHRILS